MKYIYNLLTLGMAILVWQGCQTLRQSVVQYHVLGPMETRSARAAVSAADQQAVKEIVTRLATQWRFKDRTRLSFVPSVIAWYAQEDRPNAMSLRAFEHQGKIVVELDQPSPEIGQTSQFQGRETELFNALRERFGNRLVTPMLTDYVRHITAAP